MKLTKKLVGAYARVFNSPEGQAVLDDLIEVLGVDGFSNHISSSDELWYNAGKRDTFNYIKEMVTEGSK